MRRKFALRPGFKFKSGSESGYESFFRKLAVALPANLAIFWLLLHGDTKPVLLFGAIGALLGALLLMRLDGPVVFSAAEARPAASPRHRPEAHQPDRYAGRARGVDPSTGWLREP